MIVLLAAALIDGRAPERRRRRRRRASPGARPRQSRPEACLLGFHLFGGAGRFRRRPASSWRSTVLSGPRAASIAPAWYLRRALLCSGRCTLCPSPLGIAEYAHACNPPERPRSTSTLLQPGQKKKFDYFRWHSPRASRRAAAPGASKHATRTKVRDGVRDAADRAGLRVRKPATPTGPRAWMRPVAMPSSAPRPNRNPSANRVDALWKTSALSTWRRKRSAILVSSATTQSVWPDEWRFTWATAASTLVTMSTRHVKHPYSCRSGSVDRRVGEARLQRARRPLVIPLPSPARLDAGLGAGRVLVEQQRFHRVARGGIVALAVDLRAHRPVSPFSGGASMASSRATQSRRRAGRQFVHCRPPRSTRPFLWRPTSYRRRRGRRRRRVLKQARASSSARASRGRSSPAARPGPLMVSAPRRTL